MSTFVLKREYELVMPMSYSEVEKEEMEYVDGGGWSSYRGWAAVGELTNMIASMGGWFGVTKTLVSAALASAATGVGVVVAVAAACGALISVTAAATTLGLACLAADYYLSYKGFQTNTFSLFGWTQYIGVKRI